MALIVTYGTAAGHLNVKTDFGAKGDGTTDDTTVIQAGIAAAASTGATLFFPGGTYLNAGLTIPDGIVLQGVNGLSYLSPPSPPVTTLKLKAASTNPLLKPDDSVTVSTGIQILDFMLDTNSIAQPAINLPDQGSSVPRFWLVERCTAVNSGFSSGAHGSHIYVGNFNAGVTLRDCQLLSNAAGITTRNAHGWDGVGWYGSDGLMENVFIGCYADAGIQTYGGSADITLQVTGGGSFWNTLGAVVGGHGVVWDGFSFDHNYNDGCYIGFPTTLQGCTFHSNSLQTTNTWSHINVVNPVPVTITGCRQAAQDGDAGSNIAQYFINAVAGADVSDFGNYPNAGATLGTAWRAPNLPQIASATTITLLNNAPLQAITGTTNITSITAGRTQQMVTLRFAGALTLTKGSNLKIASNFVTTADDTITLVSDGTNWNEMCRSVN